MRISSLLCAAAVAAAMAGTAIAGPNLVTNGNFADTTTGGTTTAVTAPTQFGTQSQNGYSASNFITDWTGNAGYDIWYPSTSSATTVEATSVWGLGSTANTGREMLWAVGSNSNVTSFVALDGDQDLDSTGHQVQGSIGQEITGLKVGDTYQVAFDWGAAQMQSRSGITTEQLAVTFGSTQNTAVITNPSKGFTGWYMDTMTFKATSTSEWLSFLSVGTPASLPPMTLLTNVSVSDVPEPATLALFGAGLLGLGAALVARRRRAQHDRA